MKCKLKGTCIFISLCKQCLFKKNLFLVSLKNINLEKLKSLVLAFFFFSKNHVHLIYRNELNTLRFRFSYIQVRLEINIYTSYMYVNNQFFDLEKNWGR